MSNIISELGNLVSSQLVKSAANSLGESEGGISKVIGALTPTVLGGLLNKSKDASGFGQIFDMLSKKENTNYLDNLSGLIGGGNLAHNDPKDAAGGLLGSLFGNKMGGILDTVSGIAGVKRSSTSSLLGMVAPMVMGYLGKKISTDGLNASGLASLLGSQRNHIAEAMPNKMANLIGFEMPDSLLDKAVDAVEDTAGKAVDAVQDTAKKTARVADKAVDTAVDTAKSGGNMLMKVLPVLLLAIVGFFLWKQCSADVKNAGDKMVEVAGDAANATAGAVGDAANATVKAAGDAVDATAGAIANLGNFFKRKMANGIELNIPEFGIESKLLNFLDDAKAMVSKDTWYEFDRITFDTGSATIDINKSQEQLSNIAQIMKAYPGMNIKIGGYTDNTGDPAANQKLSEARANAVKNALANLGIAANRIETEGFGDAHPVATNDTEEGRAKNRRIAVRITKK